jgi:hypothetical protein
MHAMSIYCGRYRDGWSVRRLGNMTSRSRWQLRSCKASIRCRRGHAKKLEFTRGSMM